MDKNSKLYYDKQKLYNGNIEINSDYLNNEKMIIVENNSFNDKYDEVQRINIEYNRIKEKLNSDSELLVRYINEFSELEKMLSILSYDKTLIDKIKVKIVELQILCGIKVRFTSAVYKVLNNNEVKNKILEEYDINKIKELEVINKYDSYDDNLNIKK